MGLIDKLRKPENVRRNIVALWLVVILAVMVVYAFASGVESPAPASGAARTGLTQTDTTGATGNGGTTGTTNASGGAGCACCGTGSQAEVKGQTTIVGDHQEVKVDVQGGYNPNTIEAKKGLPLKVTFERHSTNSCDKQVVFPSLGLTKDLPDDGSVTVDVTIPNEAGKTIDFTCGMSMLYGKITVVD